MYREIGSRETSRGQRQIKIRTRLRRLIFVVIHVVHWQMANLQPLMTSHIPSSELVKSTTAYVQHGSGRIKLLAPGEGRTCKHINELRAGFVPNHGSRHRCT
jgi:hypothetical protein